MKIALINENSQCGKNNLIFETLKKVCEPNEPHHDHHRPVRIF